MKCRNKYCKKHMLSDDGCQYTIGIFSSAIVENCESRQLYERDRQCDIQSGKKLREAVGDNAAKTEEIATLKDKLSKIEGAMK